MKYAAMSVGLSAAVLFVASPAVAQSDTEPPVLTNFDFNPKSIDVTAGAVTVSVEISLADSPAGVGFNQARLRSPSGAQESGCGGGSGPTEGDIHNGVWTCTFSIPQFAEQGTWTIWQIDAIDRIGNSTSYGEAELQSMGLPTHLQVVSEQDLDAPSLVGFDFNPKSIDVTAGAVTVSVEISLADSPAGVGFNQARLRSPSGAQESGCGGGSGPTEGDIHNGVWTCTFSIPQFAEQGTWTIWQIDAIDRIGNSTSYGEAELQSMGLPTHLQVVSEQDLDAPSLVGFDFNPKSIDVTAGAVTVSVEISLADSPAGVGFNQARLRSPSGAQESGCGGGSGPTEGDIHNGVWTCTFSIPQFAEQGTWTIWQIDAIDRIGNSTSYGEAYLQHVGFPTALNVCSDHLGRDTDADGWGDDCDNCPQVYNPNQIDGDGDQVGDVCDDCPIDFDPSQTDFDQDGEGDRCDLDDGLILIYITDSDYIDWQNEAGPNAWNVYEGDLSVLRSTGDYTQQPSSNPLADRRCHLGLNYTDNFSVPPEGGVQFSLVTGMTGFVEGGLGTNGAGVPRANANPCP